MPARGGSHGRGNRGASAAGLAASAVRSFGTADHGGATKSRTAVPQDDDDWFCGSGAGYSLFPVPCPCTLVSSGNRPPKSVTHAPAQTTRPAPPRPRPRITAGVSVGSESGWASAPAPPFGIAGPALFQRKPVIGPPDDPYEREADRVADQVAGGGPTAPPRITPVTPTALAPTVRREMEEDEGRERVQRATAGDRTAHDDEPPSVHAEVSPTPVAPPPPPPPVPHAATDEMRKADAPAPVVQRATAGDVTAHDHDERDPRYRSSLPVQRAAKEEEGDGGARAERAGADGGPAMRDAAARAIATRGPGAPLIPTVRETLQSRLGVELGGVRVHTGPDAERATGALRARAFTHGADIWLGRGESPADTRLVAHEVAHVLQQQPGVVRRLPADPDANPPVVLESSSSGESVTTTTSVPSFPPTPTTTSPPSTTAAAATATTSATATSTATAATTATTATTPADTSSATTVPATTVPATTGVPQSTTEGGPTAGSTTPVDTATLGAGPAAASGDLSGDFLAFRDAALARRAEILEAAVTRKREITDAADLEKRNAATLLEVEAIRVEGIYDDAVARVNRAAAETRTRVEAHRTAKVDETRRAADTEIANLQRTVADKQRSLVRIANDRAAEAVRFGGEQALLALSESDRRATEVHDTGERKVAQYRAYSRASRIASEIREMAAETARSLREAGTEMAAAARSDAAAMAEKFRDEGQEGSEKFGDSLDPARARIERHRDETVGALEQMARDPLAGLDTAARDAVARLAAAKEAAAAQLRGRIPAARGDIDRIATAAAARVDEETATAVGEIDSFLRQAEPLLGGGENEASRGRIRDARAQLDTTVSSYHAALADYVTRTGRSLADVATQSTTQAHAYVDDLAPSAEAAATGIETNARTVESGLTGRMTTAAREGAEGMRTAV